MKRIKHIRIQGAALLIAGAVLSQSAGAVLIGNGVAGDGRWEVDVLAGGETTIGRLDPTGPIGLTDLIFEYFHYVDTGSGGVRLGTSATTAPTLQIDGSVLSSGSFAGTNGTIDWTAISSIAPGTSVYSTTLQFSSNNPFGDVRLTQYLDEDVFGFSNDVLVQLGTNGANDFNLLTIDQTDNVGVSHAATYNTAQGMAYIGWAADEFSDLRTRIVNGTQNYAIGGIVDTTSLPVIVGGDSRFPGAPAFGPADITSAIAFDLDPNATFASTIFTLGGAPSGTPPPPPDQVPAPASLWLLALGLTPLLRGARRRRR